MIEETVAPKKYKTNINPNTGIETEMVLVGSIWKKTSKSGIIYFSMALNADLKKGTNLKIFENKDRKQENSPNLFVFLEREVVKQ